MSDPLNKQMNLSTWPPNCYCSNAAVTQVLLSRPTSMFDSLHLSKPPVLGCVSQGLGDIPRVGTQLTSLFLLYAHEALGGPDTPHFITAA